MAVGETYTDNVTLADEASRQDDWVTQVVPGIKISAAGTGLKFGAEYNPEILYFANGGYESEIFQRGAAEGTAELADRRLYLDFGASVDQYDASLQSPLTVSNVNATGNRSTVKTYYASPYFTREFGTQLTAEARYTASIVDSDDAAVSDGENAFSDSVSGKVDLKLASGPAFRLTTWELGYLNESIDYKGAPDTSTEIFSLNGRRLVMPTVGLLATVGHDSYETDGENEKADGFGWRVGFDWVPFPTTRFAVAAGHRFYGDDYFLDLTHRTRLTAWRLGYVQNVTTSRTEFFVASTSSTTEYLNELFTSQYADPAARERAVADFVARTGLPEALGAPANFFSNQLFLMKKWQASAGILGSRNILIANLFDETSDALEFEGAAASSGDFAASSTIEQTGASLLWNLRISGRVASNLSAAFSRNRFPEAARTDNLFYLALGLTRQLQPRLWGSLNYRRQQRDSSAPQSDYSENALIAAIQRRF